MTNLGLHPDICLIHEWVCGCPMYGKREKGGAHFPGCWRGRAECTCVATIATAAVTEPDYRLVRGMWWAAQVAAVWSGMGFALANTVDPQLVNMGIGIGFFVPILTVLAIAVERQVSAT